MADAHGRLAAGNTKWWSRERLRGHKLLTGGPWTLIRVLNFAAMMVIAIVAAAILWLALLDWNTMRGPVSRYASARLHRTVKIAGNLDVHLFTFTPHVVATGVTVANPAWVGKKEAANIGRFEFTVRLIPWLFGDTILPLVRLDRPQITVVRDSAGRTNWDFGTGGTGWKVPPINRFMIRDGHIAIRDDIRHLTFIGSISSEENANGGNAAFRIDGTGTLNGNPVSATVRGGPLINVDETKPYLFHAALTSGSTQIIADGQIDRPFHFDSYAAALHLSGANLSNIYDVTGLAMPQTHPYRIKGTLTRSGTLYHFASFSGLVGKSDLSGDLSIETKDPLPFISGRVVSKDLAFSDLGQVFGGKSVAAIDSGKLIPDLPLHIDRLRQMNASVDFSAMQVRSRDFPLRQLETHIGLNGDVLTLKPLSLSFAHGRLNGSLKIDARKSVPVTDVDARLRDVRVDQFVAGSPPPVGGLLEARALLHGSGDSVHKVASTASGTATFVIPNGSFRKAFAELTGIDLLNGLGLLLADDKSSTGVRCAVAQFNARNGNLVTQRFVFDTDPVLVEGSGSINLSDETMNFAVTGKPKEFRIGRVRAPILITGPVAHPHIGIDPGPVAAQGGLAVVLGLLFPPAAILPFVDPGLQKNANCAALLSDAHARGAPRAAH